jgi:hypothetical protein
MRSLKIALLVVTLYGAYTVQAQNLPPQPVTAPDQIVDKIFARENAAMNLNRRYSPLVEIYLQTTTKEQKTSRRVTTGDKYFLGRANLRNGMEVRLFEKKTDHLKSFMSAVAETITFSGPWEPAGFLQMIYLDNDHVDKEHFQFEFVRREFLGDVRCLVFNVRPLPPGAKGRFMGRIWVEDQDFNIVRINGVYTQIRSWGHFFHFDSWRVNVGPSRWIPAYVYSEETNYRESPFKTDRFRAQVRLWDYEPSFHGPEETRSRMLVESQEPIRDSSDADSDLTPAQATVAWEIQSANNVVDRLEKMGLVAPRGEVDKVLETVVNNIEVTNGLEIQPDVRCRVLLTSRFELFSIGHTIVLSRGLIDVLPDEAALAMVLAHEIGHIVLHQAASTDFAFADRIFFDDQEIFRHFAFQFNSIQENAANKEAVELISKSPYKDNLASGARFMEALRSHAHTIPNLISPHLGEHVALEGMGDAQGPRVVEGSSSVIAALPIGSRIKVNPWSNQTTMSKARNGGTAAEASDLAFEITPFMLNLHRETDSDSKRAPVSAAAEGSR